MLPERLRLADAHLLRHAVNTAMENHPVRIELDGSELRMMSEGIRHLLLSLTVRLEQVGTHLVMVDCLPFEPLGDV